MVVATLLAGCNVSFNSGAEKADVVEAGTADQQAVVAKAASAFLKQLDAGAAERTWGAASPYLHQLSNKTVWSVGIRTFRSSVGAFKSRKLKGVGFTHAVEGVPAGDYAAVAFDTMFGSATVEEKVVLHNDHGTWKVMGYFLSKKYSAQL
ncbi:MAG: DUF4019 domain-containing protein [Pseudomonadota bacterium]|nr:DUF4019 domain-containing protein [Pseudomonadota bacterium]